MRSIQCAAIHQVFVIGMSCFVTYVLIMGISGLKKWRWVIVISAPLIVGPVLVQCLCIYQDTLFLWGALGLGALLLVLIIWARIRFVKHRRQLHKSKSPERLSTKQRLEEDSPW